MKLSCLIAITVLLISGCGQKGPLYFAPEETKAQPPAAPSATTPPQEQERKD